MVYVTKNFLSTSHGTISCEGCHKGDPTAFDKAEAHVGIVAAPSQNDQTYCDACHSQIVDNYATSLHKNQQGYFKRIENRLGYSIKNDATLMEHFNEECGTCHATCGQCHVSRPVSVRGGFLDGHNFGAPQRDNNCVACHGSRVGPEYLGTNEGFVADVHRFKPGGGNCSFCHTGMEMHTSGVEVDYRYLSPDMPRCEDCHAESVDADNIYHRFHWKSSAVPSLSCHVCHSQPYKNCNGCHTGGAGITGSSYMKLKIAKNEFGLEGVGRDYDYVTVRHIPVAPDTYASWGIADLPNFEAEPTWKYATPHNIQRWTAQTDTRNTDGTCADNCHKSSEYYLSTQDLLDYEVEANKNIVMDDKLN
ncbi:MAG: multiheme c-type cytochrome [candidate division KSB1 bacterium]|jgi:thiosulfate/3-mercaptopyruvate sulfurtransferase|nr:multiheme c-type cytochrome [candidate division KSB1 bacterium]